MGNILIPYRGVIEIFGGIDTGKTLASLGIVFPYDKTTFVDADMKGKGTVKQLTDAGVKFAKYIDVTRLQSEIGNVQTPDQLLNKLVFPVVDEIFKGPMQDVIIWDNWNIVYQSARMFVDKNRGEFSNIVTFQGNSTIIQGLVSRVARMIERAQIDRLSQKCEILIITSHLKDYYVNNVAVGERPESSKNFDEVCSMRLWLKRDARQSDVPTIIFLKRPNLPKIVDGNLEFINIVPEKITPRQGEKSVWQAIARYEKEPIGSRPPKKDETLTPEEFSMVSGTLTNDQKSYILEVLKHQKEEEEEVAQVVSAISPPAIEPVLEEQLDKEFPALPKTGIEFVTRASKEFGMNVESIKDTIDVGFDRIMKMNGKELGELWTILSKKSNSR